MKNNLFILLALLGIWVTNAQISLTINGEEAVDGQIFTFHELGADADIVFVVTNTGSEETWTNVEVASISNNDTGGNVQFCWELCYTVIPPGSIYPSTPEHLDPGASTAPAGNHFENNYAGDTQGEPVTYVFQFREVDSNGNITGNTISITYVYEPNTSVEDNPVIDVSLAPNYTHDIFVIQSEDKLNAEILDTAGKLLMKLEIEEGNTQVDISEFNTGVYFVHLFDEQGNSTVKRIIKQ